MQLRLKQPFKLALSVLLLCCATFVHSKELNFHFIQASSEDFSQPHDIVLSPDGKLLYVSDNGNDRIVVLDSQSLKLVSEIAKDEVAEPHDVVFDSKGQLLVADTGNSRIAIYKIEGSKAHLVGELSERIRRPEGVAVHSDGRVIATGSSSNNLVVYRHGKAVAETGGFSSPHNVEIDPSGSIWVADANNDRMVQLNDKLQVIKQLSGASYSFSGPRYMDFDSSGRMYVADKYSNAIKVIQPDGTLLQVLGTKKSGKGPGVFDRPEGVEIRGNDIWFSDTYNDRIVRYQIAE